MANSLFTIAALAGVGAAVTHYRANTRETKAAAEFPPEGRIIEVDGTRMHALVAGTGPDLVLIHGASGSLRDFTFAMLPELAKRYRVIAIDRPGLGWSADHPNSSRLAVQAALLQATAAALGADRPIVLGHSYGGSVALAWALNHPDNIAALVPVSAPSHPWTTRLGVFYNVTAHPLGQIFAVPLLTAFAPAMIVNGEIEAVFAPQPAPAGYLAHFAYEIPLRRPAMRANSRQRKALLAEINEMFPRYDQIRTPVEIIHGAADIIVSAKIHAKPLVQSVADANLTLLNGIGHMPHNVAMADVIAAIDRAASRAGLHGGRK